ncbi:Na(+)/H(+) antiporter subunit D [Rhodohalobacter sp.]|uniref:Na(+)/H(+) antiporter subunit D n=1 Tax=Rhodohalobacter sp. TaxID=1974210 RepID=UPI002ACE2B13|nr:Na(+)/H(+) antiporter subunit D [Rhodohalobacter sp.]MDZ7758049.1 Na(+)/H(+) antiporter subunit D [Rhodohalobacter sp.]
MIIDFLLIPAVIVILGGFLLPLIPKNVRSSAFLIFPLLALAVLWQLPENYTLTLPFGDYELVPVYADSLSKIFGTIFAMIAIIGGIYAFHIKDLGQQSSALVYAGGALGVTFAGDYFTLYIFWELMAVSSAYLIWARRTEETDKAGLRYLLVHIFGGGLLLGGILWHTTETGSILIESLPNVYSFSSVLILLGVAVNSAIPPLHAWLADAYPKATITGAVFMSAFTTKSAVYVLIRIFPGWEILIWFGVAMALYGVVYAVLANDIRQILAYHIISQVGYMVAGVGIGTEMALNGTTAHAFSHILYKSLLFMGAGAVLYSTGKSKLTELGGFASKMKVVVFLYMIGAFSISGFPLFNGFISKSMVISAAGEAHYEWVLLLLLLASVGTFLHTGLKLPYFTWFGESKSEITVKPVPFNMLIAMGIGAFFCTLFGVFPGLLYQYLPYPVDYDPYTVYHLVETVQILVFTFIGFWILRKKLEGDAKIALDTDWFYRKPATLVKKVFVYNVDKAFGVADTIMLSISEYITKKFKNPMLWLNPFTDRENQASRYSPSMEVVMSFVLFTVLVFSLFYLT